MILCLQISRYRERETGVSGFFCFVSAYQSLTFQMCTDLHFFFHSLEEFNTRYYFHKSRLTPLSQSFSSAYKHHHDAQKEDKNTDISKVPGQAYTVKAWKAGVICYWEDL